MFQESGKKDSVAGEAVTKGKLEWGGISRASFTKQAFVVQVRNGERTAKIVEDASASFASMRI